jgi:hypothetical protein
MNSVGCASGAAWHHVPLLDEQRGLLGARHRVRPVALFFWLVSRLRELLISVQTCTLSGSNLYLCTTLYAIVCLAISTMFSIVVICVQPCTQLGVESGLATGCERPARKHGVSWPSCLTNIKTCKHPLTFSVGLVWRIVLHMSGKSALLGVSWPGIGPRSLNFPISWLP